MSVNFSSQLKKKKVYHMEKNSSLMLWSIRTWKRKRKKVNAKRKDISDKEIIKMTTQNYVTNTDKSFNSP